MPEHHDEEAAAVDYQGEIGTVVGMMEDIFGEQLRMTVGVIILEGAQHRVRDCVCMPGLGALQLAVEGGAADMLEGIAARPAVKGRVVLSVRLSRL